MIIIINNNDYNDSNSKGKALKVATKKTLKYRNYFLPDFWNVTALKSLQFRFQKSIKSLLLQLFPFSLTIIIILIITIVFLILVLFIWLYFQFIFYDGFLRIVSLLFLYLFSFLLFGSYSKFIFVPFFFIYFLFLVIFPSFCASNESIMYFICLSLFSVLSLLAL